MAGAGKSSERQKWQCAKGMVSGLLPRGVGVVGGADGSGATCNGVHVQLCGGKWMMRCTCTTVTCTEVAQVSLRLEVLYTVTCADLL